MIYGRWLYDATPEEIKEILNKPPSNTVPDKYFGRIYTISKINTKQYFRESETKFKSIEFAEIPKDYEIIPIIEDGKEVIFIEGNQLIEIVAQEPEYYL